ncbi:MAG: DUF6525 family protein [Pseudomonadota bacterium]
MARNLGQSSLRKRRRARDPMGHFDGLPAPLRRWLAQAALPWSPSSAQRLWRAARARGLSAQEAIDHLSQTEARMLARDRHTVQVATADARAAA